MDTERSKEASRDFLASHRAVEKAFAQVQVIGSLKALEYAETLVEHLGRLSSDLLRIELVRTSDGSRDTHALDHMRELNYEKIIDALRVVLLSFKNAARMDFGVPSVIKRKRLKRLGRRAKVLANRLGSPIGKRSRQEQ
jgi:hypothetical protein